MSVDGPQVVMNSAAAGVVQKDLVPVCRELGVGIVCYSPIGRGMLAGKYSKPEDIDPNDFRSTNPRFVEEAFAKVGSCCSS